MRRFCLVLALFALASCGFPVRNERVDGPYVLFAADLPEDLHLSYDLGDGGMIGRVPARVIAVGYDARYVTVARRPPEAPTVVEYYYVVRALDGPYVPPEALKGHFDRATFEQERVRLSLPPLNPVK